MSEDNLSTRMIQVKRSAPSSISIELSFAKPDLRLTRSSRKAIRLALYAVALLVALYGNGLLRPVIEGNLPRHPPPEIGTPYVWLAMLLWLAAEVVVDWHLLKGWWTRADRLSQLRRLALLIPLLFVVLAFASINSIRFSPVESTFELLRVAAMRIALAVAVVLAIAIAITWARHRDDDTPLVDQLRGWLAAAAERGRGFKLHGILARADLRVPAMRQLGVVIAAVASAIVWEQTTDNRIELPAFLLWIASIGLWALVLSPPGWNPAAWLRSQLAQDIRIPWRRYWWAIIAFGLILFLGVTFRLTRLEEMPPELTNDTYANTLDVLEQLNGNRSQVYFHRNTGRDAIMFYLSAALASLPGFAPDFYSLKLSTVLVSLAALPMMFWLGYEFIGPKRRRVAVVMGLSLAALVAVSFWDTTVSRNGLRYVLAPFFAAWVTIYLMRAARYNRRGDFIKAGIVLGLSLYSYHSLRAMPIAVVAVIGAVMLIRKISWRERATYAVNLAILAFISLIVFLPALQYSLNDPGTYWLRVSHLILNDRIVGSGAAEDWHYIVSELLINVHKHLLMFNFGGENGHENNLPGLPAMDVYAGALFIIGIPAFAYRMVKTRDPAYVCVLIVAALMIFPSLITLDPAYRAGVPSHTRGIGILPFAYLIAAFPLALIARRLLKVAPHFVACPLVALLCSALVLAANQQSTEVYFGPYYNYYRARVYPSRDGAEIIRGFIDSGGAMGNTFIFAQHMGEARFITGDAGAWYYENYAWLADHIGMKVRDAFYSERYPLDPQRDLLFMLSTVNYEIADALNELFPNGYMSTVSTRRPDFSYAVYRVPALGIEAFNDFLARHAHA